MPAGRDLAGEDGGPLLGSRRHFRLLLGLEAGLWGLALAVFAGYRSDSPTVLGRYSWSYAGLLALYGALWLALLLALIVAGRCQRLAERGLAWLRGSWLRRGPLSLGLGLLYGAPIFLTDAFLAVPALVLIVWTLALVGLPLGALWLRREAVMRLGDNVALSLASLGIGLALLGGLYMAALAAGLGDFRERNHYFYGLFQPDEALGWRMRPNLENFTYSWQGQTATLSTDEMGYRNAHPSEGNPIAVLGDSFGVGSLVNDEAVWTRRLEQRTGQQVANYSVGNYSLWHYDWLLRHEVLQRGHRLVLYTVFVNDLETGVEAFRDQSDAYRRYGWDRYRDPWTYLRAQVEPFLTGSLAFWRSQLVQGAAANNVRPPLAVMANGLVVYEKEGVSAAYVEEGRYEADHRLIGEAIDRVRAQGMDIVVLLFPSKESVYREQLQALYGEETDDLLRGEEEGFRLLCEFVRSRATLCYDLTDDLRRQAQAGPLLYFERDAHWNPAGNAVVGDLVGAFLEQHGLAGE